MNELSLQDTRLIDPSILRQAGVVVEETGDCGRTVGESTKRGELMENMGFGGLWGYEDQDTKKAAENDTRALARSDSGRMMRAQQ